MTAHEDHPKDSDSNTTRPQEPEHQGDSGDSITASGTSETGEIHDHVSVEDLEEESERIPNGDPDKPNILAKLADSLYARSIVSGNLEDVDSAIGHLERALALAPREVPAKTSGVVDLVVSSSLVSSVWEVSKIYTKPSSLGTDSMSSLLLQTRMMLSLPLGHNSRACKLFQKSFQIATLPPKLKPRSFTSVSSVMYVIKQ